eukprot:514758_1
MSSTPNEYITFLDSLSDDSFIDAINSSINIVGKTKFLTILQQGLQSTINDEKQSNDIVSELQIVAKQFAARQKKRTLVTTIGDRVKLKKHNAVGTVRFIGEVTGKKGIYYGIELDDDEVAGQMNGYFKNIQYFDCERYNGLFVEPQFVKLLLEHTDKDMSMKQKEKGLVYTAYWTDSVGGLGGVSFAEMGVTYDPVTGIPNKKISHIFTKWADAIDSIKFALDNNYQDKHGGEHKDGDEETELNSDEFIEIAIVFSSEH